MCPIQIQRLDLSPRSDDESRVLHKIPADKDDITGPRG